MSGSAVIENNTLVWIVSIAGGGMVTAIKMLWSRLDRMNTKCVEDRDKQNQDRIKENNAWFERVEGLYKERGAQAKEMFDQVIKLAEKSKDTEHATINALTENARMVSGVNETMKSLKASIDDTRKEIRLLHGQAGDPSGR